MPVVLWSMVNVFFMGEVDEEGIGESIRLAYREFYHRFHQHERAEAELMMLYCNEEIGVGD